MATIYEQAERTRRLTPEIIERDLLKYLVEIRKVFFDKNIDRLQEGKNSKGGILTNKNKKYSGVYTKETENIAKTQNPLAPKIAGELYNFLYFGDFIKGFEMFRETGKVEIFSTGTGSGSKMSFFDGYEDLFDVSDNDLAEVTKKYAKPFIQNYIRKGLGL